jgi:hypothetical protein
MSDEYKAFIEKIVYEEIKEFASQLEKDYCNPKGKKSTNIVSKGNNVFIASLGKTIMVYSTLMRSLDSSLGKRIEKIAKRIAERNYIVENGVKGSITQDSSTAISDLLNDYKTRKNKPQDGDLKKLFKIGDTSKKVNTKNKSDYYLVLKNDNTKKYLLELKIGGDLDNKKAESEKNSLLHQFATLRGSNEIKPGDEVKIFFCTAYNKYGDDKAWTQERVRQFFSEGELLIGKKFWNFICLSKDGFEVVNKSYIKHSHFIKESLNKVISYYLGKNSIIKD